MAFLADIENAIAIICAEALVSGPCRFGEPNPSTVGPSVRIYRGWPTASALNADLAAGSAAVPGSQIVNVTIYSQPGHVRITPRYANIWRPMPRVDPTLEATASEQTVTLSGIPSASQVLGIAIGQGIGRQTYSYRPTATDTLDSIAASMAGMIPNATSQHAQIQLPAVPSVCTVAADQSVRQETRRQTQGLMVSVWAPSSQTRDTVAGYLDAVFSDVQGLALPDNSGTGPIGYTGVNVIDVTSKDDLFRADLLLTVNYATTKIQVCPVVIFTKPVITPAS
jgi:hypothetical protein